MLVQCLNGVKNGGVGLVAQKPRMIKSGVEYNRFFAAPTFEDPFMSYLSHNEQTLSQWMPEVINKYKAQTAQIALQLKKPTLIETLSAIWKFVYTHIAYCPDRPMVEEIRTPNRTWRDRKRGVDCDCYSVFISTILCNLGIPHLIRMAAYSQQRGFQHVYVIVPKAAGLNLNIRNNYYVIDDVLDKFNDEKPYLYKKDHVILGGANSSGLNGVGAVDKNGNRVFPVRCLNGRNGQLVYTTVYYNPEMKTWALKGLDGAFYLQGNPNSRYVDDLNGTGLGWIATALKAAKGVVKGAKKVVKAVKTAKTATKAAATAAKDAAKTAVSNSATAEVSTPKLDSAISQAETGDTGILKSMLAKSNNNAISAIDKIKSGLQASITKVNNNAVSATEQVKENLKKTIQAANKANITSLQAIDTNIKRELNTAFSSVNNKVDSILKESKNDTEATKKIQAEVNEKMAAVEAATEKSNRTTKLAGIGALATVLLFFISKKIK